MIINVACVAGEISQLFAVKCASELQKGSSRFGAFLIAHGYREEVGGLQKGT